LALACRCTTANFGTSIDWTGKPLKVESVTGTSLAISKLALGGWLTFGERVAEGEAFRLLKTAVNGGINFIDLADVYGNGNAERIVGKFLKHHSRDKLIISSKVYWPVSDDPNDRGLSRGHILRSIDGTLRRLDTSYVDLYFCHREDPTVSLLETAEAMHMLVCEGKIRAWGTSCWRSETLRAVHTLCQSRGLEPPRVEQPPYSLLERSIERDILPTCSDLDMATVVWSPLAGGALTGKYIGGIPTGSRAAVSHWLDDTLRPAIQEQVLAFVELCSALRRSPAAVALAWVIQQKGVTAAITGATNSNQLLANLESADIALDASVRRRLDEIFPPAQPARLGRVFRAIRRRLRGQS